MSYRRVHRVRTLCVGLLGDALLGVLERGLQGLSRVRRGNSLQSHNDLSLGELTKVEEQTEQESLRGQEGQELDCLTSSSELLSRMGQRRSRSLMSQLRSRSRAMRCCLSERKLSYRSTSRPKTRGRRRPAGRCLKLTRRSP